MFFVYVLKSKKNSRFYIGHTSNLERRIEEHNRGESKYTRLTLPFDLIYSEKYNTRVEATRRERGLKSGQGRAWLKETLGSAVA